MTGSKSAAGRAAADAGRGQENKAALDNTRKWSPEARSTTRLFEAWFQQKLFDDRLSIRLGQLSADTEFMISPSATLFVNSTFGFPRSPSEMEFRSGGLETGESSASSTSRYGVCPVPMRTRV